jgi:transketolase
MIQVFAVSFSRLLAHSDLTRMRQVYIFTHDSVGVGEDGPTHQPVETVASMRLMPNMDGTCALAPLPSCSLPISRHLFSHPPG